MTTVSTLDCALARLSGGSTAVDCVLLEFGLLCQADKPQAEALFAAADLVQAPVVLMAGELRGRSASHVGTTAHLS